MSGLTLTSPVFVHNKNIPYKYTYTGEDINPPLEIDNIPDNTSSLVLIIDDPDAPVGTWDHWILYNILPTDRIEEDSVPSGATQGENSWGNKEYGGPCPPSGTHRYVFTLYALDTMLVIGSCADKNKIISAMDGHIIEKAELIGLYSK